MDPNSSSSPSPNSDIQDLITRIELASENIARGNKEYSPTLTPHEGQKLLAATRNLIEKLEGPDTAIWKIIFGVKLSI